MSESKIEFKNVVKAWWKFFWRYALLWVVMLIAGGRVINYLSKSYGSPEFFLPLSLILNLGFNLLVSFLIFRSILGKQVGKSGFVIVPSTIKRRNPGNPQAKINPFWTALAWWNYFWRFALFAFAMGFLGDLLFKYLGLASAILLKYPRIIGNISVLPASLLVFILLMWRSEKRRKLDLVPVQIDK